MAKRLIELLPERPWTVEEFLAYDDGTDTRYELHRGELVAMAPPLQGHGRLVVRLAIQLASQLRLPCEAMVETGIKSRHDSASFYQADLAVSCAPPRADHRWAEEPVLVAEVRSPSTERHDLYEKLIGYQSIASVQDILVLDTRMARIDHFVRDGRGWRQTTHIGTGDIRLAGLEASIDLARLYEGLLTQEAEGEPKAIVGQG